MFGIGREELNLQLKTLRNEIVDSVSALQKSINKNYGDTECTENESNPFLLDLSGIQIKVLTCSEDKDYAYECDYCDSEIPEGMQYLVTSGIVFSTFDIYIDYEKSGKINVWCDDCIDKGMEEIHRCINFSKEQSKKRLEEELEQFDRILELTRKIPCKVNNELMVQKLEEVKDITQS